MKRNNLTKITLMLASVFATSAIGGIAATVNSDAADAKTYLLSDVFAAKSGTIDKNSDKVTSFTLSDGGSVYMKRDLAFKWYESATPSYFNTSFTLADSNFDSVSLEMEAPSAWASEDDKTKNVVTFEKTEDGFDVYVNKSTEEGATNVAALEYNGEYENKAIVVSLSDEGCEYGQYKVNVSIDGVAQTMNDTDTVSRFVNVGQTYAEYSLNKMHPLTFLAKVTDDTATAEKEQTVVLLNSINGQAFNNVTDDKKVADTAPAVLVVGEEVSGFQLGTAFALTYDYMDVLSKNITITREYYQYNPAHEEVKYNTLNTNVIFQETAIEATQGAAATTVYETYGKEFVSIKFTLSDGTFTEDNNDNGFQKPTYHLSWYADQSAVVKAADVPFTAVTGGENIDYIAVTRNEDAPKYRHLTANDTTKTNDKDATYYEDQDTSKALLAAKAFQAKVTEAAKKCFAGGEALELESVDKLIFDNNGYRSMKFTISYYTPTSSEGSPSTLSDRAYNAMEIPVASEGNYQFKIFAKDKAGNQMKYYIDDELVTVDATNVWDIDEIPSFTFYIESGSLSVEEGGSTKAKKDTEVLDANYTFDAFEVEGAANLKESYSLYKLNVNAYNALKVQNELTSITYAALTEKIQSAYESVGSWSALLNGRTYAEYYLEAYCEMLAEGDGALAEQIYDCFEVVGEPNDTVNFNTNRWESHNWNPNSRSFTTVETGTYLLLADFWENEKPTQRVAAYRVLEVSDKVDEILGANNWLENNVVSVILFAIAGVMLILIIILLLIKPSDEQLEEVTAKKQATKNKKK